MLAYIKSELWRQVKSKRYFTSFLLLSVSILILFQLFSTMSQKEGYSREEAYLVNNDISLVQAELTNIERIEEERELYKKYNDPGIIYDDSLAYQLKEVQIFEEIITEEREAFYKGDMESYMKKAIQSIYYLMLANKETYSLLEFEDPNMPIYHSVLELCEKYNFPPQEFKMFKAGYNSYGELYASIFRYQPNAAYFQTQMNRLLYYDQLLENGHTPVNVYQVDSITIAYQVFRTIFPIAIPLLVVFLFFDTYDNDVSLGTTKAILSLPYGRKWYVFAHLIANTLVALSLLFIPLIIFIFVLGLKDGFHFLNYPLLTDSLPLSVQITPTNIGMMNFVYKTDVNGLFPFSHFGLSQVSNYSVTRIPQGTVEGGSFWAQLRGVSLDAMILSTRLTWSSLGFVLLLAFPLIISFTIVCISIILFLNLILEKKMNVLLISIAVFLGLYILSPPDSTSAWAWINPFHFRNAIYNVTGFTSYSWILGMISTLLSSAAFILLNYFYIMKKDVTR